jgi:hypothetical protein
MRERESKAVCRDWVGVAVCLIGDRVARFNQQRHCYSHTRLLKCISQQRAGRCSSNERGFGTKSSHKHHRDTRHHHHKQQPEEQQTTTTTQQQQQQQQQRNDEGERRKTNSHNGRCEAFCSGNKAMCAYAKQLLWLESCRAPSCPTACCRRAEQRSRRASALRPRTDTVLAIEQIKLFDIQQ